MQRNLIIALHGFLGQGSDWDQVKTDLQSFKPAVAADCQWVTPDLFGTDSKWLGSSDQFCTNLVENFKSHLKSSQRKIFLGYSLGGRLGLQLLKNYADQFDHFIFISAHSGLTTEAEKESRKKSDANWSLKISSENWSQFLQEWNEQDVLKSNVTVPVRQQKDFSLEALQSSLSMWSLGEQQDLRKLIKIHQQKITWAVGAKDLKFLSLAEELLQKKILLDISRIFSGHRILFENPKELVSILFHQLR